MSSPITVLYLDHTAKLSGGEIALVRLLEAIDRTAIHPVVVLAEEGPLTERLRQIPVETHVLPLSSSVREVRKDSLTLSALRHLRSAFALLGYCARLARFTRKRRIQILHTNSLKSDVYGAIAGRLSGTPVVWHIRDHIDPSYLPKPAVKIFRYLAQRWPNYVVANSQSTLDRLFLDKRRPSAVVPSGIDFNRSVVHDGLKASAPPVIPEEEVPAHANRPWSAPVRIGLVGRLASWKGQHIFIEAAAQVLHAGFDTHFVIAGSALFGEKQYEEDLHRQVEALGIADRIEFAGFVKNIPALLESLDILVHASTTPEPFGQVVIEGMAEGLPVIGTDGGGVREIIVDGENGLLVPMGDADAMAQALLRLLRDPDGARRLGRAGYLRVRRHFTADQTARKIERVYREVLDRP